MPRSDARQFRVRVILVVRDRLGLFLVPVESLVAFSTPAGLRTGRPGRHHGLVTQDGLIGTLEERCDTYRLDGPGDIGVKLRFQETLQPKVRQSVGTLLTLVADLAGRPGSMAEVEPS